MSSKVLQHARRAAFAAPLLLLAACGRADRALPSGQVAARVNQHEISLHQVQHVLQRDPRLAASRKEAPRLVLDSLVEQEIAAQAAREEGIENDPAFVQGVEAAKRELAARLYQERLAANVARPTTDDVDRYYEAHPALFSERRLYTLQEAVVELAPEALPVLRQLMDGARSAAELLAALDKSGLRHRTGMTVQAPEAVPMRWLDALIKLEEGRSMLVSETSPVRIWTLVRAQDARIDRQQAREAIESYLLAERKREAVSRRMQALRGKAQVVLAAPFTGAQEAAASAAARP